MYKKFENYLLSILNDPAKKKKVLWGTLGAFVFSVALIPTELVLAKMLPGKNNDTYSVYIDLPGGSSIEQTREVSECVVGVLQNEPEALDAEVFLGTGSPLDFAGLIKGSHFKNSENVSEIVVNLTKKHDRDEPSYMMVQRLRPVIVKECENLYPGTSIKFIEPPAGSSWRRRGRNLRNDAQDRHRRTGQKGFQTTEGPRHRHHARRDLRQVRSAGQHRQNQPLRPDVKHVNDAYTSRSRDGVAVKNSRKRPTLFHIDPRREKTASRDKTAIEYKLPGLLMNQMGMMVPITKW